MMIAALLTLAATGGTSVCNDRIAAPTHSTARGFTVSATQPSMQRKMLERLGNDSLVAVDAKVARMALGTDNFHSATRYYLARVGYLGWRGFGAFPDNVTLAVKVDRSDIAHVNSFRFTRDSGVSEMTVILAGPRTLRGIVSTCGAAS